MVRIPLIRHFRFSLRTVFITLFALSVVLSNYLVSQKWRQAQAESQRLRRELGVLTIDNPKRFYVCEMPKTDIGAPMTWDWRIYVPRGEFDCCLAVGGIPKTGLAERGGAAKVEAKPGEFTLTARVERDPLGKWRLTLWGPTFGQSIEIPPKFASWLSEGAAHHHGIQQSRKFQAERAGSTPKSIARGEGETQSFSADEPLVLLRLRAPEDLKTDTGEPCDGVMIWFDKRRVPPPKAHGASESGRSGSARQTSIRR